MATLKEQQKAHILKLGSIHGEPQSLPPLCLYVQEVCNGAHSRAVYVENMQDKSLIQLANVHIVGGPKCRDGELSLSEFMPFSVTFSSKVLFFVDQVSNQGPKTW